MRGTYKTCAEGTLGSLDEGLNTFLLYNVYASPDVTLESLRSSVVQRHITGVIITDRGDFIHLKHMKGINKII